jgi:hypothetical protein
MELLCSFGSGMSKISDKQMAQAEKKIKESEAMIRSMTPQASPAEAPSGEPIACCLSGACQGAAGCKWLVLCILAVNAHACKLHQLLSSSGRNSLRHAPEPETQQFHLQTDLRCRAAGAASAASHPATCAAFLTSTQKPEACFSGI